MPIRWGICSTGKIAETFAAALNSVDESICAAVSSRSLEKAEKFAGKYGFEKAFGSLEEMLSAELASSIRSGFDKGQAVFDTCKKCGFVRKRL